MGSVLNAVGKFFSASIDILTSFVDAAFDAVKAFWDNMAMPVLEFVFSIFGFEDEEVYAVQVLSQRLIPEDQPNGLNVAILRSLSQSGDIIENIKFAVLAGPVNSIQRYQQYGEATYIHGLPTTKFAFKVINLAAVKDVLDGIYGEPVTIITGALGQVPDDYWVKFYLQENENYSEAIGIIWKAGIPWTYDYFVEDGVTGEYTVYLKRDILTKVNTAVNPTSIVLKPFSATIGTNVAGQINATKAQIILKTYPANIVTHITTIFTTLGYLIPASNINVYYNIKFYLDSTPSASLYWVYQRSLGTYPNLDGNSESGIDNTLMLPIVPLRQDFANVLVTDAAYETSDRVLETIGIDFQEIIDAIADNPDIAQIEDAFILFAINLYTKTKPGLKAVYIMWYNFFLHALVSKADYDAVPPGEEAIFNTISSEEGAYNIAIVYDYVTQTDNVGVLGPIDTYTSEFTILPNTPDDPNDDTKNGGVNSYAVFRWQYDANNYSELLVHGLFSTSVIKTTSNTFKLNIVQISDVQAEMDNFMIPVSFTIFGDFNYIDKEILVYESFSLVIYAADSIHLDWYETSAFSNLISFVLKVVAIAVLFFSWGTAKTASAALWALTQQLLIQYALTLLLEELLLQAGDDEDKQVAALVTYLIASYYAGGGSDGLDFAEILLKVGRISLETLTIYAGIKANELQREIDGWTDDAEARQQELDDARDGLAFGQDSDIDFYEISTTQVIDPYMTPTEFYALYAHSGNIGVQTLSQIENYVDNQLKLPEKVLGIADFTTTTVTSSNEN